MIRTALKRNARRVRISRAKALPAPVEGWDATSALASMGEKRAVQLKNWFPQPGYVEVRRGFQYHAWELGSNAQTVDSVDDATDLIEITGHGLADGTAVKVHASTTLPTPLTSAVYYVRDATTDTFKLAASDGGAAIDITSTGSGTITVYEVTDPDAQTLMAWQGPASSKMLAIAGGAVWDVTAEAAATFSYGGLSTDRCQWCNHTTSAGQFVFVVNGSDAPVHYNGTTWATPSITGITAADAVHVISHKKRLWFVLNESTKAAYLGTEAVAGAAAEFQFGSLFTKGGYLLALATWTRDGGSGSDDYFVAISSRGQVAVYQGTDPASANTWALVGTFDVPTPIGRRCFTRYGGDVLLLTVEGVFPLSQLLAVDQSQTGRVAISERISQAFNLRAVEYSANFGWEACVYAKGTRLIVNIPTAENVTAIQYVMNTLTGAWCEFDAHNANTWLVFNDTLYFGGAGYVYEADTGSADIDQPIVATGQSAYLPYGGAYTKLFSLVRPLVTATGTNRPSVGMSVDFVETDNLSTQVVEGSDATAWDGGGLWDGGLIWSDTQSQVSDWMSVGAIGTFGSVKFQATIGVQVGGSVWGVSKWGVALWGSGANSDETMRMQGILVTYEQGDWL